MAKKLIINCGDCDARNVSEETLAAYESVSINAGDVLVTPETKALLSRYGVTLNSGNVMELDQDVKVTTFNGPAEIKSTDIVGQRVYATFNGPLEIGPDTQTVLDSYAGIVANGPVTCPESMSGYIGSKIRANGPIRLYPDGAIVLKRNAVIDKLFVLRAKPRLYWAAKRMVMVDPQLDAEKLAAKGVTFSSREVIIAESKVEALIGLIDEKADIIVVPDGTAVIQDDVELTDVTVKKYGTKLYITGDLMVTETGEAALSKLEYLNVQGDTTVIAALKDTLLEKAELGGDVKVPRFHKGRLICDKMIFRVTKWMLEREEGLTIRDCITVVLDAEIPSELILARLEISDCVEVKCAPEQEAAVSMICHDVVNVGQAMQVDGSMGIEDMIKSAMNGQQEEPSDTKVINAGDYVL